MDKQVTTSKTKQLEDSLKVERTFSERQIINAEKAFSKWFHYIIAESGHGKIEVFIDAGKKIIDVSPTPGFRFYRD